MKRLISLLLAMAMLGAGYFSNIASAQEYPQEGDIVLLGAYEQDNDLYNGPEPIEWRVLFFASPHSVMLISQKALDAQPFNEDGTTPTHYAFSSLREWLNNEFINAAFTSEAQQYLEADRGFSLSDKEGNSIPTKVYLLDHIELEVYFENDKDRIAEPTEYALSKGVRKSSKDLPNCNYWLGSIYDDIKRPAFVTNGKGWISSGDPVDLNGVRPVIWVDLANMPALEDTMPEVVLPTPEPEPEAIVVDSETGAMPPDEQRASVALDDPIYPLLGQYLGIDSDETYNRLYFYANGQLVVDSHAPGEEHIVNTYSYELIDGAIYLNGAKPDIYDNYDYSISFDENGQIKLYNNWSWTRYDKVSDDVTAVVEYVVEIEPGQVQGVPELPSLDHLSPDSLEYHLMGRFEGYYYDEFVAFVFYPDGTAYVLEDRMNDLYWVCSYTMEDDLIYVESPKGYTDTLQITVNERECYIKYYNDYGAFRKK
ncbi:MAG: hypothetical protein IJC56_06290 [Clostridia bacterium]|nr:hypothetical protein [Clostridia bacterium]